MGGKPILSLLDFPDDLVETHLRVGPFALDGPDIHLQGFRDFNVGHSSEKFEHDDPRSFGAYLARPELLVEVSIVAARKG